jgi:1-acyl-sn-glycerol-3-phosphate acyltransferase
MIAELIRLVTGAQARWRGIDAVRADGSIPQRIYFANHQSNLDAPVIWASLTPAMREMTCPIAARDYWQGTPLRQFLADRVFHCVLIERQKVTKSSNPLKLMEDALAAGKSLILFPEGTRTLDDDGDMRDFKPGLWHLAKKHPKVELVPVHLENLNRILPKGDFLLVPLLAAVTFGSPIDFREDEDKMDFLARARHAVESLGHAEGA